MVHFHCTLMYHDTFQKLYHGTYQMYFNVPWYIWNLSWHISKVPWYISNVLWYISMYHDTCFLWCLMIHVYMCGGIIYLSSRCWMVKRAASFNTYCYILCLLWMKHVTYGGGILYIFYSIVIYLADLITQ